MALCDAVTVMRAGAVVLDCKIADTSIDGLAQAMVGRPVNLGRDGHSAKPGAALLTAQDLRWRDALGVPRLDGISLTLHAGEIVGIAGVSGNGQSELLDVLSGLLVPQEGTLDLGGQHYGPRRWLTPAQARELRLAHVPEDRHTRGLVLPFEAWESAVLGYQSLPCYGSAGMMDHGSMRGDTARMMERYDVRPRNPALRSSKFSGGNQQKLVLAREAEHEPRVLLVGQPTRGVDIGAIEFIHDRLRAMRDGGGAVLVVSSELDEVLALADRVIVMNAGRIAGELAIDACTESALGRLMGGADHV
jgi:general nucleoside transport system ATP-binding protein